jgi:poly(3-hydroxybutyrate) depolymerase
VLLLSLVARSQQVAVVNGKGAVHGAGKLGASSISLSLITVTPTTANVQIGATQDYVAIGTFSDGTQQDITGSAGWSSSNVLIASLSASPATFTCNAAGVAIITAAQAGRSAVAQLTCAGLPPPPVRITTSALPDGQVGVPYSVQMQATNGILPYFWSIFSGSLPSGLTLNLNTGILGGTPAPGSDATYTVAIQVVDSSVPPVTSSPVSFTFTVAPAVIVPGNLAELPRAYPNPNECPAPAVVKKVCNSGDSQCPTAPGDYAGSSAGLQQCLADGVASTSEWLCRITPGIAVQNIHLPIRPPSATSCISIDSSAPITAPMCPTSVSSTGFGWQCAQFYFEQGQNAIDNAQRWIAQSTGNSVTSAAIFTDAPDLNGNVAHHYQISDVELAPNTGVTQTFVLAEFGRNDSTQTLANQQPHDIFLKRAYLHGSDTQDIQHAVQLQGHDIAVTDSVCDQIHFNGTDSQCFSGNNGAGIYQISNSYIRAASENIIWGGSFSSIANIETDCDIWIAGNYFSKDINWFHNGKTWNIKNLYEEKTGCRHLIEKNHFKNTWPDGQAGGDQLWSVRFANGDQTIHDITMRNNLHNAAAQFFNGIDGGSDGSGNGQSPSLGADFLSIYNNLAYDIGSSRFAKTGGTVSAQGFPMLAQNQKFGGDSATITSQTRDAVTGLVTIVLSAAPPQLVPGLSTVVTGSSNSFDGTFVIFQVLSATSFIYVGAPGVNTSSTGGTASFPCTSVSDAFGNITTNCPDTNCGLRSPCGGGLEIRPGEWVQTLSCSNSTFNVSQAVAAALGNPHSLAITYPWATVQPNATATCQLVNHQGSPRHLYLNHNAVYMRNSAGAMMQSSPQNGAAPSLRDVVHRNLIFTAENGSVFGMLTSGTAEGTPSELKAWATSTAEIHHIVFQGRLASKFTEWLTPGSAGITPPTTIFGPTSIACSGVPDANCMGLAGNYVFPNPDAGGTISGLATNGVTATATVILHDIPNGATMQALIHYHLIGPPQTKFTFSGPVVATVVDPNTVTFPSTLNFSDIIAFDDGNLSTGHDYHDFVLCTSNVAPCKGPSFYAAGRPGGADDGTMMGPDIVAMDLAFIDPTHPTPGGGGGGGGTPTITAIFPTQGFAAGGELVTVTGTNFTAASVVSFGTTAAATTFVNATTLTAVAPAGSVGPASISVNAGLGNGTPLQYLYLFTPTTSCNFALVGQQDCTITYTDSFGSITRTMRVNNPHLVTHPAVVIYYHGAGGGLFEGSATGWTTKSNNVGFITIYPQGWPQNTGTKTWNAYFNQATYTEGHPPDDSYFTREMAALMYKNAAMDPKQLFLTGFSAGGHGAYRYAFDDPDIVAAVGGEATVYFEQNTGSGLVFPSPLTQPVSVIQLQGSSDGQFSYCGVNNGAVVTNSADELFNYWSGTSGNNCSSIDTTSTLCTATFGSPTSLTSKKGSSCSKGTEVQFYKLANGGHQYYGSGVDMTTPPGTGAAPYNPAFNGIVGQNSIDIFWNFFVSHPKQ